LWQGNSLTGDLEPAHNKKTAQLSKHLLLLASGRKIKRQCRTAWKASEIKICDSEPQLNNNKYGAADVRNFSS
jgi:hypothetical protein